ncbi:MAG: CBS domain-containing protein [Anaerolineaceae bacterium]|nr:CBS domain-containing protein [Anaerolineaceae bacterium]
MDLILTHEQTDLDGLASMLGAHLLRPEAIALLPRQINRNGKAFLRRYANELPFSDYQALPHESISSVFLVDTQSLVTLRGMNEQTNVTVLDHHPRKVQIHPNWQVELHLTGACTTILVEKLKEQNITLSPIEATLMLLGIYEDTGSLTYSCTTPADARAVAFLLEQGADLNIASIYLNPPLSNAQQQLYDRLLKDLIQVDVEGYSILVAKAIATDLNDEISTVAHKMREFLTPDGLVLLVSTRQGIRLVARSTTDNIDMSRLALHFGGGGHKRAASALIREEGRSSSNITDANLAEVAHRVIETIPQIVIPGIKVSQMMSRNPLTLSPLISAVDAAELMKRYGFEGYPVVDNKHLVGLLTRRNVDRAIAHNLSKTAGDLMTAGSVSVYPDDPISRLKERMATSGWGQVPVLDPETSEIIGIVTRTDLISTLNHDEELPTQAEIAEMLSEALPPARKALLQAVADEAYAQDVQAFIVGGFVRDLLLQLPSQDFDIVIEGDALTFASHLAQKFGGRVVSHRRFGTAKWILNQECLQEKLIAANNNGVSQSDFPEHLDLITARTEFYNKPAALPIVERSSIKMDLHRRDFTINTLALRLDGSHFGKIFDFWGGYSDLQQKQIRVLHALSFVDDATRMLRAVRFAERFNFEIEPQTLSLIEGSLPLLAEISGARLTHEFDLIFNERNAPEMLRRLGLLGILAAIDPALPWDDACLNRVSLGLTNLSLDGADLSTQDKLLVIWCLWLKDLQTEALQAVGTRLRLSSRLIGWIGECRALWQLLPTLIGQRPSQITRDLEHFHPIPRRSVFAACDQEEQRQVLQTYEEVYRKVRPFTTGDDLRAFGLPPSPRYDIILSDLKRAWLDGELKSEDEEKAFLRQLLDQK